MWGDGGGLRLDGHVLDYSDVSDPAQLIPARRPEPHPWGAPRRIETTVEYRAPRRPWLWRITGGLVSLAAGVATAVSETVSAFVASVVATTSEALTVTAHLLGLVGAEGGLGVVGRLLAVGGLAIPLTRLGWRLARWGAAPIGDDQ